MSNPLIQSAGEAVATINARSQAAVQAEAARLQAITDEANRIAAERQAQAQAQAAAQEQAAVAAATTPAPQQVAAAVQPPPTPTQTERGWQSVSGTRFSSEWLPSLDMNLASFAALPFEQRQALADRYVAERGANEQLAPQDIATLSTMMESVVYADEGGRKPGVMDEIVDNDLIDKVWAAGRNVLLNTAAGGLSLVQADGLAQGVRDYNAQGQANDYEDFSARTKDTARIRAQEDALRLKQGDTSVAGDVLYGAGAMAADLWNNPLAGPAELLTSTLPTILAYKVGGAPAAAAVGGLIGVTGAREQARAAIVSEDFSTAPGWASLVAAAGSEERAKQLVADQAIDDFVPLAAQLGAGAVEAVGGVFGIERLFGRAVAGQVKEQAIRKALQNLGIEGLEESAAGVAGQVAENVAVNAAASAQNVPGMTRDVMEGAAQVAGQDFVAGVVAGGVITAGAAGAEALVNGNPVVPFTPPAPTTPPGPVDPAAPPVVGAQTPAGTVPDPIGPVVGSDGQVLPNLTTPGQVPERFTSVQALTPFVDTRGLTPEQAEIQADVLDTFFGLSNEGAPSRAAIEAAVPGIVFRTSTARATPPSAPTDAPPTDAPPTDAPPTDAPPTDNVMPPMLTRRDDTGVPDTLLPNNVLAQLDTAPQPVAGVLGAIAAQGPTEASRGVATYLTQAVQDMQNTTGAPVTVQVQDNLTFTSPDGTQGPAAALYQRMPDGSHSITLNRATGRSMEAVQHEVTHAVTMGAVTGDPLRLTAVQRAAVNDIKGLHSFVQTQSWANQFSLDNTAEFVAEAFSNPRLQQRMKDTPYSPELSVWGKFNSTVRGLMGMDNNVVPDNVLDAVLVAIDGTVQGNDAAPSRERGGQNLAYHAGDLRYGGDTTLGRMMGGRSTGHFGTGVYFVGAADKISGREGRPVHAVDLSRYRLARPLTPYYARMLHDSLKLVNRMEGVADIDTMDGWKAIRGLESVLGDNVDYRTPMAEAIAEASPLKEAYAFEWDYIDTAATRLMKKLGYDGVDTRGIDGFDTTEFGTVVYAEAVNGTVQDGDAAPSRERPTPPDISDAGVTESPAVKAARIAEREASRSKRDFMSANFTTDSKDVGRGSAYLKDPARGIWQANFIRDDGIHVNAEILGFSETKAFLERFRTITPDGKAGKGQVNDIAKDSGYAANYDHVMSQIDGLSPRMRTVYSALTSVGVPAATSFRTAGLLSGLSTNHLSRTGGLDVFGKQADLKNRASYLRSLGKAMITSQGTTEEPSFADKANGFYARLTDISAQGVPMAALADYFHALSAAQDNALKIKVYPTDKAGRPRDPDFAKFSYVDTNGKTVSGTTAAPQYIAEFMARYGDQKAAIDASVVELKAHNKYVLDVMLLNGVIGPAEHAQFAAQDLYLPKRQLDSKRPSGAVRRALGRSTKAQDPLLQWRAVMEQRLLFAHDKGAILAVGKEMQQHPNLNIGTVNTSQTVPRPFPDLDEDGNVLTAYNLRSMDWGSDNTVSVWDGERQLKLKFVMPSVVAALKPTKEMADANGLIQATAIGTRLFSAMLVGTPAFWLMSAAWDLALVPFTTQGSFQRNGKPVSSAEARKIMLGIYKSIAPALGGSTKRSLQEAAGLMATSNDPMRQLYNATGGGVRLGAATDTADVLIGLGQKSIAGKSAALAKQGFNLFNTPGHVMSDAVRFSAFKSYLEQQNGGPFRSAVELSAYAEANPDVVQQATIGSKMILGNYEDVGGKLWVRAIVPFYNASSVGFQHNMVNSVATPQGRAAVYALTGVAVLAAMGSMAEDDDEDSDGFSKYMRRQSAWTGIQIGDSVIPVPPEFRIILAVANMAAAQVLGRDVDMPAAYAQTMRAALSAVPIVPGVNSATEGRPLTSDLGLLGVLYTLGNTDKDMFGNARVNAAANRNENLGKPYYMTPRNTDSEWAVSLSKFLHDNAGSNISPGSIDVVVRTMAGGWDGLRREKALGRVDGRGETQATLDWLTRGYNPSKDNEYASRARWEHEKGTLTRDSLRAGTMQNINATVEDLTRGMGAQFAARSAALRSGDSAAWQSANELITNNRQTLDAVRKQHYELTGNQKRNVLIN